MEPFVSVQVNVDENGENILADAANEPSIAIDPTDASRIAVVWRQFDTVKDGFRQAGVGHSTDGGRSWTFPGPIDPGNFRSDPVVESNADGIFYYYGVGGGLACDMFISHDGGRTWSDAIFAYGGDKPWFAIDTTQSPGRGNIYVAWSYQGNPFWPDQFTRSTNGGTTWMSPIELLEPRARWGTLTVDADGTLYLCGVSDEGVRLLRSSNARNAGQTPTWDWNHRVEIGGSLRGTGTPNRGGLLGQYWIAADRSGGSHDGNIYMLASVDAPGDDPLDVMFIRSDDRGETWSQPVPVNDDEPHADSWQWFGTISVAPGGRIDAVWNDTRSRHLPRINELYYAFSKDGGRTWSPNTVVSPRFDSWLGGPAESLKLGDYIDMSSDDTGASVAYAATFHGEQDVYYLRIELDYCRADIDGDLGVTFEDLVALLATWGPCARCAADLDEDGDVDFNDLIALLARWGPCPVAGACCLSDGACVFEDEGACAAAGGFYQGAGSACFAGTCQPSDFCELAPSVGEGTYPYSTLAATSSGSPELPAECDEGNGILFRRDVWTKYTASCDGMAAVSVCDSDFDARLAVYRADGCPGVFVACRDDACGEGGTRSEVSFVAAAGQVYLIRIGSVREAGRGILVLECAE